MTEAFLEVRNASKSFGTATVLDGVALEVAQGEFVSLLGPSGCGKTTLLRIIAGLTTAEAGAVILDGQDISARPPHKRDVGVVFQNYALFPHLSVAENIGFGLRGRVARHEIMPIVTRFLDLVRMGEFADRSVRALSGGQQQRVAVARALAVAPKLLLLDEPFSALDRKLREIMQMELKRLLRELGTTAIFVTHDQDEALVMSDRIAVMNQGRIEQLDTPQALYDRPVTPFALQFVGLSTRIFGEVASVETDGTIAVQTVHGILRAPGRFARGSPVLLGIRPERISFGAQEGHNTITPKLADIVFQGARVQAHFTSTEDEPILLETSARLPADIAPGATLPISWTAEDTLVFPRTAGA
ncbi:MAG: ABC transporter ATP-binding protein [Roseomonas sp.]|nr:ABC transporter ATP-binding protein [Roseomonas sp.]